MIGDWIEDHLGWLTVVCIALLVWAVAYSVRGMNKECADMMKLAHDNHDSLMVHIACNNMRSDMARNAAIGAAAGAIAGSAGRR